MAERLPVPEWAREMPGLEVETDPRDPLWPTAHVAPARLRAACERLRDKGFVQFVDLAAVDFPGRQGGRFDLIVQLRRLADASQVRLVCQTEGSVPSLCGLFPGANWAEREAYDLFGIVFEGHPDLRRLLLPDDWEGHPLRRDYPLHGPRELQPGSKYAL